ncbi:MAG TPA: urea carboxylase-associated family protein [Alphaproteobacteria bacterium]|nr:urea carboxylase-associated family protein [Alphaproteobacteria bacterium]
MDEPTLIPARRGKGAFVDRGRNVKLINTYGYQVVDTWAFNKHDLSEFMSMEHCRSALMSLTPKVGESLVTNKRRPILTLVEDTTDGVHDMLFAACDRYRYELLGCKEYHDNCTDNLATVFKELSLTLPETPCPFNAFQNSVPEGTTGKIKFLPPVAKPGQYIVLRAEMDLLIAFSCCPQDLVPVNGPAGGEPRGAHFEIL